MSRFHGNCLFADGVSRFRRDRWKRACGMACPRRNSWGRWGTWARRPRCPHKPLPRGKTVNRKIRRHYEKSEGGHRLPRPTELRFHERVEELAETNGPPPASAAGGALEVKRFLFWLFRHRIAHRDSDHALICSHERTINFGSLADVVFSHHTCIAVTPIDHCLAIDSYLHVSILQAMIRIIYVITPFIRIVRRSYVLLGLVQSAVKSVSCHQMQPLHVAYSRGYERFVARQETSSRNRVGQFVGGSRTLRESDADE